jgi:hypothetical protein
MKALDLRKAQKERQTFPLSISAKKDPILFPVNTIFMYM